MAGAAALGLSRELRTQPVTNRPRTSRKGQVEHKPVATSPASASLLDKLTHHVRPRVAITLLGYPGPGDPDTACTVSHNGLNHLTRDDRHVQALCGTYAILSKAALPADTSTLRRLLRR
jgi:hypothetical protein